MYRIRNSILLLAIAVSLTACGRQAGGPDGAQPVNNLLLICIDTVRADTFFKLGELNPDRLSAWEQEALVFTQAAAPSPWTVPSVASAFTGLWPMQHGAGLVAGLKKLSMTKSPPSVLLPEVRTIAQAASDNGFSTTVISASDWTFDNENPVDISRGFEDFHAHQTGWGSLGDAYWKPMMKQWRTLIGEQGPEDRVVNFVHFLEAHNWHFVLGKRLDGFLKSFTPEQMERYLKTAPQNICEDTETNYCRRYVVYAHAVEVLRGVIADMLDTLQANGQLENTAVVLFSDHGEEFGDRDGEERDMFLPITPRYLGHAHSLYEELLHVPLLVWHPGVDGKVVDTPVSLIDIAPSAAYWLDLDFAPPEGQAKLLHEHPGGLDEDDNRVLFASHLAETQKQFSARAGSDKAIWYMASDRIDYFDLENDPEELNPVTSDALVLAFDGHFLAYEELRPEQQSESASFTDDQIKRLQAIGYLQGSDETGEEEEK